MAKWSWYARAYAIKEFAYMKQTEYDNQDNEPIDCTFENIKRGVEIILEMAQDNYISVKETPYEYRTIKQCKKWLNDFKDYPFIKNYD